MQIFLAGLLFICGLCFTVYGGDSFILAASRISEIFAIPKFIIGATVVSLATTLPELLVSLFAAADGKTDMAIGNAIGSVSANTGLILALSIIFIPCSLNRKKLGIKCLLLVLSAAMLWLFSYEGFLSAAGCSLLLCFFAAFIFDNISSAKNSSEHQSSIAEGEGIILSVIRLTVGALGIIFGAELLVDNASVLGLRLGISEAIISTTVLAVGTSLPELITTICAIKRQESSLSIGNIIGANIIDLTIILPLCSLLSGKALPVTKKSFMLDMPFCFLAICIAVIPAVYKEKFSRIQGFLLLFAYITYMAITIFFA